MAGRGRQGKKNTAGQEKEKDMAIVDDSDENVGIFWLACHHCEGWEIFENSGIPGKYSKEKAKKVKFSRKNCQLQFKLDPACQEISLLNDKVLSLENDLGVNKKSFADAVKNIPEDIISTKATLAAVCNDNAKFREEITKSFREVQIGFKGPASDTALTASQLQQAAQEVEEISKRKLNLIISGLPERSSDLRDLINFVQLHHSNIEIPKQDDFVSFDQIGKPLSDGRPCRLLRVRLQSAAVRSRLLYLHTYRTTQSVIPKIYIRPDLTKVQSANDKKLREEWDNAGKIEFKISRGK